MPFHAYHVVVYRNSDEAGAERHVRGFFRALTAADRTLNCSDQHERFVQIGKSYALRARRSDIWDHVERSTG